MHVSDIEPLIVNPDEPGAGDLGDLALTFEREAAALEGTLPAPVRAMVAELMRVAHSYYSNRIEGNDTRPAAINAAMRNENLADPKARALQRMSWAHVEVERLAEERIAADPTIEPTGSEFLRWLHREFYERVDPSLRWVENPTTGRREPVVPGELRTHPVTVGRHVPPPAESLDELLRHAAEAYDSNRVHGLARATAFAASHHRLMWIHPFGDGNGRVLRLATVMFGRRLGIGGLGLWTPSRGLARRRDDYLAAMAEADLPRRNDLDGRGALSREGLISFIRFFLEVCLDQVRYMREVLALDRLGARFESYARMRADGLAERPRGVLRAESGALLRHILVAGELPRAEAAGATGLHPRVARRVVADLLTDGLITSPSPRGMLHVAIPLHAVRYVLPALYPEGVV